MELEKLEEETFVKVQESDFIKGHAIAVKRGWTFTRFVNYGKRIGIEQSEDWWTNDYRDFCIAIRFYGYTMKSWNQETKETTSDNSEI